MKRIFSAAFVVLAVLVGSLVVANGPALALDPPSVVQGSIDGNILALTWTDVTGAAGYEIDVQPAGGGDGEDFERTTSNDHYNLSIPNILGSFDPNDRNVAFQVFLTSYDSAGKYSSSKKKIVRAKITGTTVAATNSGGALSKVKTCLGVMSREVVLPGSVSLSDR